jgi:hypothetical protein
MKNRAAALEAAASVEQKVNAAKGGGESANNEKSIVKQLNDFGKEVANKVGLNDEPAERRGREIADQLGFPRYDRDADNYHSYGRETAICALGSKGCTTDFVAERFSCKAAPGQGSCTAPGETKRQDLVGGNQIIQFADKDRAILVNVTMPQHWLRDGFVVRWIGVQNGMVTAYTYGEGVNINVGAQMFNYAAGNVFKLSDWSLRADVKNAARKEGQ